MERGAPPPSCCINRELGTVGIIFHSDTLVHDRINPQSWNLVLSVLAIAESLWPVLSDGHVAWQPGTEQNYQHGVPCTQVPCLSLLEPGAPSCSLPFKTGVLLQWSRKNEGLIQVV